MMSKVNLKWAKSQKENSFNFGDDLNPYIISKLTGFDVNYIHYANSRINILKEFIKDVLNRRMSMYLIKNFVISFFAKKYIIGIGSIIQWYSSNRCIVWGSGVINEKEAVRKSTFLAVRGYYTKSIIEKHHKLDSIAIGDPALLLPLVYNKIVEKKYKFGIIPHVMHFQKVKSFFLNQKDTSSDNIIVIDLSIPEIEMIIDQILSCEKILSTSLHGLIVPHSYGIDAIWVDFPNLPSLGDRIKFYDYFSSVGIVEYEPEFINKTDNLECYFYQLFEVKQAKIGIDIFNLQRNLLSVAPFQIKKEYYKTI